MSMKLGAAIIFVIAATFGLGYYSGTQQAPTVIHTEKGISQPIGVFFSPKGGCIKAIVDQIANAKTSIYFQSYSFTSEDIAKALIDAHKRGVEVHGLMDKSDTKVKSTLDELLLEKIDVLIDSKHAIAHNKIVIIDKETVITGSFNFTNQAEHANAENLLVIHNVNLATLYMNNWTLHHGHSLPKAETK